eukprot:600259-Amphidinium_carterae.1
MARLCQVDSKCLQGIHSLNGQTIALPHAKGQSHTMQKRQGAVVPYRTVKQKQHGQYSQTGNLANAIDNK